MQLSEDVQLNEKTWNHDGDLKKAIFLNMINKLIIYKFLKRFFNQKKKDRRF